jgi:serine O-acetyltransferase
MNTLFIYTKDIGPGLYIQHGFATIISAKSIGKDCWINQQVTIGYSNATDCPVVGVPAYIVKRNGVKVFEKL